MVKIIGCGAFVPKAILKNKDLEKNVETTDEWIVERTGIRERRIADKGITSSQLGSMAALAAIADSGIHADAIDGIIVATSTPDMFFPSTACLIQKEVKAVNAFAFDISAACSGFIYALSVGEAFIRSGRCSKLLIVGSEVMSSIIDWTDRNTCVLFGDGAGAVILSKENGNSGILSSFIASDGNNSDLIEVPGGGSRNPISQAVVENKLHYVKMKGNETFRLAVKLLSGAVHKALEEAGLSIEDISLLVPHQANIRILNAVADKLGLPAEKVFINLQKYGNTSAASIPIALAEAKSSGKINKNDIIVLCGFGGGLTWGASVIRW